MDKALINVVETFKNEDKAIQKMFKRMYCNISFCVIKKKKDYS